MSCFAVVDLWKCRYQVAVVDSYNISVGMHDAHIRYPVFSAATSSDSSTETSTIINAAGEICQSTDSSQIQKQSKQECFEGDSSS